MLKKAILVLVLCAVCSMFAPAMAKPEGTHGTVKYQEEASELPFVHC